MQLWFWMLEFRIILCIIHSWILGEGSDMLRTRDTQGQLKLIAVLLLAVSWEWSVFVCPIGGTLPPPCCPLSSLLSHVPGKLKTKHVRAVSWKFCVFLLLLPIFFFLDPLLKNISGAHILASPRSVSICHTFTISVKIVPVHWLTDGSCFSTASVFPPHCDSFVKQAASTPGRNSHKSKQYPGLSSSLIFSITTCDKRFIFLCKLLTVCCFLCKALMLGSESVSPLSWLRVSR